MTELLRPVERRILAMRDSGIAVNEIASRLRRTPTHIERMIEWTNVPRSGEPYKFSRALESRVLALRDQSVDHDEIGRRFKRTPANIRQIEALAYYRKALDLIRRDRNHQER